MSSPSPDSPPTRKGAKKSEALWLASFSDMSLSLLCFFVLMISTMKPDKDKFNNIKDGMATKQEAPKTDSPKAVADKVQKVLKAKNMPDAVTIVNDAEGLHMEFNDGLLFQSGATSIVRRNLKTVQAVMAIIAGIDHSYRIHIEGHTDDTPLQGSAAQRSNWELSAARGFTIMRQLQAQGVPEGRLAVTAYAHTRPKVPYEGLRGKALAKARAANRRVVIWLE